MMNFLTIILIFSSSLLWAAEEVTTVATTAEPVAISESVTAAAIVNPAEAVTARAALDESQIPLSIETSKKSVDSTPTSTRLFLTGFILCAILGATYYLVRKYKLSNSINKSNTKIKVLSQHYLGPKKSLAIIHVAGESMLIGITDQNISMIKSLSLIDDEVPAELPQNFSETLQMKSERPAGATAKLTISEELEEEFSFAGVKDTVSKKIKSMRSLS